MDWVNMDWMNKRVDGFGLDDKKVTHFQLWRELRVSVSSKVCATYAQLHSYIPASSVSLAIKMCSTY